jgi:hypothetical protein
VRRPHIEAQQSERREITLAQQTIEPVLLCVRSARAQGQERGGKALQYPGHQDPLS